MKDGSIQTFMVDGNMLAYRKIGTGPATLISFHGFGQSHDVFIPLKSALANRFTIFAIDLFFHGNSQYAGCGALTKSYWYRLVTGFLHMHGITRFSLLGFSLGGRFALVTAEAFAGQLDCLFLVAPDGITQNGWYRLATASVVGRKLFRYVLKHLPLLSRIGHGLVSVGLLDQTLVRFAELSLGTPEQRELAYQSWTQFRLIQPDLATLSARLADYAVLVHFFTGSQDRIVPGAYILPLVKKLCRYELTILDARHNHLIELAGAILANAE